MAILLDKLLCAKLEATKLAILNDSLAICEANELAMLFAKLLITDSLFADAARLKLGATGLTGVTTAKLEGAADSLGTFGTSTGSEGTTGVSGTTAPEFCGTFGSGLLSGTKITGVLATTVSDGLVVCCILVPSAISIAGWLVVVLGIST